MRDLWHYRKLCFWITFYLANELQLCLHEGLPLQHFVIFWALIPPKRAALLVAALLFVFTPIRLPAQPVPAPVPAKSPPSDLVISWDQTAAADIHVDKATTLAIHLKNGSAQEIEVTHFALNNPSVFVPIGPIDLKPGGEADFPLELTGRILSLPATLKIFFQFKDGSFRSRPIELSSKDVLVFAPRYVLWRVGDPAEHKTVHIVNTPQGVKVTGVSSSSPAFTAKLVGDAIAIAPAATTQPQMGTIAITTEPSGRQRTFISAAVIQAFQPVMTPPLATGAAKQ
jgi:hypothetical protein